ncbi:MAG: glycosyltransferase family 4 protein [Phycisphaerae bacterium]|nr:glycosyltransferase family 4 protein [Phycisphaerae bacterium]
MRIALVKPYFMPGLGYEATAWYHTLLGLGHQVRMVATPHVRLAARQLCKEPFPEGVERLDGGEVYRLHARMGPRDMVFCPGVTAAVREFRPELTIIIKPGILFAKQLVREWDSVGGVLMCTSDQNRGMRRTALPWPLSLIRRVVVETGFFVMKRRAIRECLETCDVVLLNTPDTFDYLLKRIARGRRREALRRKCLLLPLGFETPVFYDDPETRAAERRRLGIAESDIVGMYSFRMERVKRLDIWVSAMSAAMRRVPKLRAMLVGIEEDDPESRRVLSLIEASGVGERFICLPFANREELPRSYNAADFGVWHLQPSITIQEAMGTGLYMVLTNDSTVSHLVLDPETGRYFEAHNCGQLEERITETAEAFAAGGPPAGEDARRRRAKTNAERFGYRALAQRVVAAAEDPANAAKYLASDTKSLGGLP